MTSVHKDVARTLLAASEAEDASDATVGAALREKTGALIERLAGWFPAGLQQTAEGIAAFQERCRSEGLNAAAERFFWSVAQAEIAAMR